MSKPPGTHLTTRFIQTTPERNDDMAEQLMKSVVHFAVNRPGLLGKDLLQLRFDHDVCTRSHYPVYFYTERVAWLIPKDPDFVEEDSTIVRSLVVSLIKDGHTGVESVYVASSRVLNIYYDPKVYLPDLLKEDVKVILRDVNRHSWDVEFGW